jgi:uncharacterized RDD family membrane protein YckC
VSRCPSCNAEIDNGMLWCPLCHAHVIDPRIGFLASPAARLGAFFLDWLTVIVWLTVSGVLIGISGSGSKMILLIVAIGFPVYQVFCLIHGTSPGKRLMGMKVVSGNGNAAGFLRMILREIVGKLISSLILSFGFIWILIDRYNQGWHDKLASTYVITIS